MCLALIFHEKICEPYFQTSLSNQYTHLYNEISRVEDRTPNSRESSPDNEAVVLSAQIKNFIKARIALVMLVYLCIEIDIVG
jgi:hypothetical protein